MDQAIVLVLKQAKALYDQVQATKWIMTKLKVTLNGIIEGLESYLSLAVEGNSKVIDSIQLAIEGAANAMTKVQSRGCITQYAYAMGDGEMIENAVDLLENALESLLTKVQLANDGAERGKNITQEQINKNAMQYVKQSENALIFWRDFVPIKSWQINTQMASFYLRQYIEAYNSQMEKEDQIRIDNLQLVLANLIDVDGSGTVTPAEIGFFFTNYWDPEKQRAKINAITKERQVSEEEEKSYLLIKQICTELGLDFYFEIMKAKGVTTHMFLQSSYPALKMAFKEMEPEHVSLLYMKAQEHLGRKEFYLRIKKNAIQIESDALVVVREVENAYAEGRLKYVEKDKFFFWIEDPEEGNGLCIFKNDNNEYLYSRRRAWKCHGYPARYTNNKGNSFYIKAYANFARMGYYTFYSEQRQEIHYCSKNNQGNNVYKIIVHGKQGQQSMDGAVLHEGFYEVDGESIIIENDMIEYKKYFVKGKEVDWNEYKKNRPQDRLNFDKLEEVQKDGLNMSISKRGTKKYKI